MFPWPWLKIEQYLRPGIGFHGTLPTAVPGNVKQPSVNLKFAPEPGPGLLTPLVTSIAATAAPGTFVYTPGSNTPTIAVTLPPETVTTTSAGAVVLPVFWSWKIRVP